MTNEKKIQLYLSAIKHLLQPEPEGPTSSVIRLTNLCNNLERESEVKQQLLDERRGTIEMLQKRNNKLEEDLNQAGWDATKLKRELARKKACLKRAHDNLGGIKKLLEQGLL